MKKRQLGMSSFPKDNVTIFFGTMRKAETVDIGGLVELIGEAYFGDGKPSYLMATHRYLLVDRTRCRRLIDPVLPASPPLLQSLQSCIEAVKAARDSTSSPKTEEATMKEVFRSIKQSMQRLETMGTKATQQGTQAQTPIPMILYCPMCNGRHIDKGEFATRVHHTHSCQHCGLTWRPAIVPTVGVQFLPGYKDP